MMPWFPRDFIAATLGWTLLERGLYVCLLFASWELGDLPASEEELARIAGATPAEFSASWPRVRLKFEANASGKLVNNRLEQHRAKALKIRESRASAGRAGGFASGVSREASVKQPHKQPHKQTATKSGSKTAAFAESKTEAPSPSEDEDPLPPPSGGSAVHGHGSRAEGTNPRAKAERTQEQRRWAPLLERGERCGFRKPGQFDTPETYETSLKLYERDRPLGEKR